MQGGCGTECVPHNLPFRLLRTPYSVFQGRERTEKRLFSSVDHRCGQNQDVESSPKAKAWCPPKTSLPTGNAQVISDGKRIDSLHLLPQGSPMYLVFNRNAETSPAGSTIHEPLVRETKHEKKGSVSGSPSFSSRGLRNIFSRVIADFRLPF